jgi:hypothetical protein
MNVILTADKKEQQRRFMFAVVEAVKMWDGTNRITGKT